MATTFNKVCGVLIFLLFAVWQVVDMPFALAQDALCAEVKIEIKQKLSLERQAFDAHMRITNGLDTSAIENVGAVLHFEDDKGNKIIATSDPNNTSASFFARIDSLSGIDSIEGAGRVNPKTTADIHWLIIPAQGTGGTEPGGKLYYIGATLTYTLLGQQSSVEVTPDYVTVKPQPLLDIDYFLADDVYADDPFTAETEPAIPFTLGVRINNVGAGPANKVTIESAQPRIVENKQGLLIDFKIIDSYVSDQPAGKTLLIDFGDIAPQTAKVGRWNMITTLSGRFVEINANYTHADSLGGALTSLIRNINSYLLVHDVKADLPGRDNIRDFLARSGDVLRVYESDGNDFPVIDQSSRAALQSGASWQLTFPATTGFAYAKVSDPFAGKRTPSGVKRSDGKLIPPENVWLSQTRDENNQWQYFINIFDVNTTGRYTFDFVSGTVGDIAGFVYYDANSSGRKDEEETGMANVKVTLQGSNNEGAGVSTTAYTAADGTYKFTSLKPGAYRLKVDDVDGYTHGARVVGSAGGTLSANEENLITDIALTAGANAFGYGFAKRKPASSAEEGDLAVAMTADKTLVRVEDIVVFSLIASNVGLAAVAGVTVTDKLPQGLSLVGASASVGSYDAASGIWTIGTLDKDATAALTLTAKVDAISESITNMATIASSLLDSNPANNTAQVTLMPESALFTLSMRTAEEARILILVSCPDTAGKDDTACAEAKAMWVTTYLAERGYSTQVVTTTEAFRTQLRAGKHNVYWVSGGAGKLTPPLADEIRMAVWRGDTLINDGARDAQSAVFDDILGAAPGAPPGSSAVMIDNGAITVSGETVALILNGAETLAYFSGDTNVAIARHAYGQGATLSMGFDLIGSLQMTASEPKLRAFLIETLGALTPATPETLVGHAYLPVVIDITHHGKDAETADVSIVLPTGVEFVDASPSPSAMTGDRITWTLALAAEDLQSLRLGVRVPAENTALHLTAGVAETDPEVIADLNIDVTHFDAARINDMVTQIGDPAASEKAQAAQAAFMETDYATAIAELVKADQALPANADGALRMNLAHWLREAELLWQENPLTPSVPASIVAVSGTPQTAVIRTAFAQTLQARVLDSDNRPVPETRVTFNLPTHGAGGTFFGGGTSVTVVTDAQGLAVTPAVMANGITGNYTAIATAQGVVQPASFMLANQGAAPMVASIAAESGTPQSATINTIFAQTLQAIVLDVSGRPVPNTMVTFTLPASGASASFAGGGTTATAMTDAQGIATSPSFTANATTGSYQAEASVSGIAEKALFDLTNEAVVITPVAASITAESGTPQTAEVGTAFTAPLQALVKDTNDAPMGGVEVTFTLPASGASASFAGGGTTATAMTDAQGIATSPSFTANATTGSYQAEASVSGVTEKALFDLTNEAVVITPVAASIAAESGTPQTAEVGTAFTAPLQALIKDTNDAPMGGVEVTFTLPATGASANFTDGGTTATAMTDAQGIATSPSFTANATTGSYQAEASVSGVTEKALFDLTNEAVVITPVAASIVALNDTVQASTVNTVFAYPLRAKVLDADQQPMPNVMVMFALPASGASAVFAYGQKHVAVMTDAQGVATAPIFTANETVGHYVATATVDGVATPATFVLINSAASGGSYSAAAVLITAGGDAQIAAVGTTFMQPLQVIALDAESRPVPDLEVTFVLPTDGASAWFTGDVPNAVVKTDVQGVATSPTLTANAVAGSFSVTVMAGTLRTDFTLMNRAEQTAMPSRIVVAAGTPQTATVNAAFGEPLKALVLDADQQPLPGIAVTFALPESGASASFPGSIGTITTATDENGLAVTPALVANHIVGGYRVVATVEGIEQGAEFVLTNSATPVVAGDIPATITAVGGTPQTATVGTAFAQTLQAGVWDADHKPVANAAVTFTLPTTGASAAFMGIIGNTVTVATNVAGIAVSPILIANAAIGDYVATARINGVATAADFSLANEAAVIVPVVVSAVAESGTPQSTEVHTAFAAPLKVLVKDTNNAPMAGVAVTFALPASGASALFDNGRNIRIVLTDANGVASSRTLVANGLEGTYSATAIVFGLTMTVIFDLTNEAVVITPVAASIAAESGTPQTAEVGTAFTAPLQALVKDTNDAPMGGVEVTFTLPATGASANFTDGGTTATAMTDAQGIATSPNLTANATTGSYQAEASVSGVTEKALFTLTNTEALANARAFSGPTATGSGMMSAIIAGGGSNCAFDLDRTRTAMPSGLMMNLLGKYLMPHGVFEFVLVGCDIGSTVTVTTTWPNLKGITGYMKYGPTPLLPWVSVWYVPSHLRISGNSVSYTITDGALGDDDLTRNGVIRDPGGPVIASPNASAVAIPVLGRTGLALLLLLTVIVAMFGYRRVRGA